MRALVVDDDLVLADVISFTLRRAGFEVILELGNLVDNIIQEGGFPGECLLVTALVRPFFHAHNAQGQNADDGAGDARANGP